MMTTKNNGNEEYIDDLLVKYLLKETGHEEKTIVEQWISASEDNKKHFRQLKETWDQSLSFKAKAPSEKDAWKRFRQRVQPKAQSEEKQIAFRRKQWITAAAVLLILITGSWLWYRQTHLGNSIQILASKNNVVTDTLSDHSIVTLNKDSRLIYPRNFGKKSRRVQLEGEAFFKVIHNSKLPFIVEVNNLTITDIGTSFNINARKNSTEIIVTDGIVKVSTHGKSIELHANEKITILKNNQTLKKEKVNNKLYNYYRTKEFICNNTPLKELVATLNEAYNANVIITNPQLEQLPITTTFHRSQPLDSILSIISQTFGNISLSKKDNRIILK